MDPKHICRLGLLSAALALGLGLASATAQAQSEQDLYAKAKTEGKLVYYAGLAVPQLQAIADAFKKQYPGIEVEFLRQDTAQSVQRFEAETGASRHVVDVMLLTDRQSKQLHAKGWLAPYKSRHIDLYPKELHGVDSIWSNYGLTLASFGWNTDDVKPADAPKTWDDLLNPKWKNKVAMQELLGGGGSPIWFVTMYEVWGEQKWADYMKKLGAQNFKFGGYLPVQEMLASGEVAIQVAAYPNFLEPLKEKGGPVEWGTPDPIIFTGQSTNISKFAPHPSAARLFVDFLISREGQELLGKQGVLPALKEKWGPGYAKLSGVRMYPQAHELETARFDYFQEKKKEFFNLK